MEKRAKVLLKFIINFFSDLSTRSVGEPCFRTCAETVEIFIRCDVFDYIRKFYDILHTTGHQYVSRYIDIICTHKAWKFLRWKFETKAQ